MQENSVRRRVRSANLILVASLPIVVKAVTNRTGTLHSQSSVPGSDREPFSEPEGKVKLKDSIIRYIRLERKIVFGSRGVKYYGRCWKVSLYVALPLALTVIGVWTDFTWTKLISRPKSPWTEFSCGLSSPVTD